MYLPSHICWYIVGTCCFDSVTQFNASRCMVGFRSVTVCAVWMSGLIVGSSWFSNYSKCSFYLSTCSSVHREWWEVTFDRFTALSIVVRHFPHSVVLLIHILCATSSCTASSSTLFLLFVGTQPRIFVCTRLMSLPFLFCSPSLVCVRLVEYNRNSRGLIAWSIKINFIKQYHGNNTACCAHVLAVIYCRTQGHRPDQSSATTVQ